MRWLIIHPGPSFSVADVHNGWSEALRGLGEEVVEYSLDSCLTFFDSVLMPEFDGDPDPDGRRPAKKALTTEQAVELAGGDLLLGACNRWWPHVVLCVSAFFIPQITLEVMRARGHKIVMLFTEAPYQDRQQLAMAGYASISLVNDPVSLDRYREVSGTAEYVPHSYRPKIHYPAAPGTRPEYDLAFVGTGFPSRIEFFDRMRLDGLRVALGGFWGRLPAESPLRQHLLGTGSDDECVDNTDTAALYRRAAAGVNLYRREGEDGWDQQAWAMGPREVEMAACGLWFARDGRPESDELFPMLPAFTTPEEAGELIRWAATHPAERERAAAAAREAVADRTFDNAAKRLIRLLEQQKGNAT